MAAKESRGLPDSLKQSFNFNKPRPQTQPEPIAPDEEATEFEAHPLQEVDVNEVNRDTEVKEVLAAKTSNTVSTSQTPLTSKSRGGRPRGVGKVKKTLYLTTGMADLRAAQLELAARARTFIRDESDVVDLALAFLHSQIADPRSLEKILALYNELNPAGKLRNGAE